MISITGGPGTPSGVASAETVALVFWNEIGMSEYGRTSVGDQLTCRRLGG